MSSGQLQARPARASQSTLSELMMPNMANNLGNVFGGVILSLIDRAAAVAAARHARGPCVTVAIERVEFREPIHLGELVIAKANVNYVGRTSLDVGVRVEAENLSTGKRRHTNSCHLTFVAIDSEGRPKPVAPVVPKTHREKQWYEHARSRREREGRMRSGAET
ncbi:MAG: acyl-CoA thioesterase [Gemmatimonadota bacterium]|nr:MAG: acyl-CoA thioesterase [Gemmatimonadota bacterium]